MFKRTFVVALACLMLNLACYAPIAASTKPEEETKFAAKVKAAIDKIGTGTDARIEVKLRDKTKLKGYVSERSEDHFIIVDAKTGVATMVMYPQVKQVKGHNLSTGAKIAIGIAVTVGILAALFFYGKTHAQ